MMKKYNDFINEYKNDNELYPAKVSGFIYHTSIPMHRDKILRFGLKPQERSARWLEDTMELGNVIFASMNKNEIWDSTFDDDIYKIDTSKLNNNWFFDPNFNWDEKGTSYILTGESIPIEAIELIHKGTGKSK